MERLTKRDGLVVHSVFEGDFASQNILHALADYEDAEEQGLLLRLPCKIGKNLYDITEFVENIDSPDIYIIDTSRIEISKDKFGFVYCIDSIDYREEDFGITLFKTEEDAIEAIRNRRCSMSRLKGLMCDVCGRKIEMGYYKFTSRKWDDKGFHYGSGGRERKTKHLCEMCFSDFKVFVRKGGVENE